MRVGLILGICALAACGERPRAAAYFEGHPAEATRVIQKCAVGNGQAAECSNARDGLAIAERKSRMKHYRRSFQ